MAARSTDPQHRSSAGAGSGRASAGTRAATASFGGHVFADPALLARALTHRSAGTPHNERLEFLGDALIGLIAAELVFTHWPAADEGALTRARAELVRESALAGIARELDIGERLSLGPGERKTGGHRRDSILADAVEATVAAIYLDAGWDTCRAVARPWFAALAQVLPPPHKLDKDAKTRLQEWLQGRGRPLPVYSVLEAGGDDHDRVFEVLASLSEPPLQAQGNGGTRRAAEQAAAQELLALLEAA